MNLLSPSCTFIVIADIWVIQLTILLCSASDIKHFTNYDRYHQNVFFTSSLSFNETSILTLLGCAQRCSMTVDCVTLTFLNDLEVKQCQGHSLKPPEMVHSMVPHPSAITFVGESVTVCSPFV